MADIDVNGYVVACFNYCLGRSVSYFSSPLAHARFLSSCSSTVGGTNRPSEVVNESFLHDDQERESVIHSLSQHSVCYVLLVKESTTGKVAFMFVFDAIATPVRE